ncbi:MAG: aspartate carbamoyltransferase regulatory subunit [Gammaproteobacteria bacterium RIFCSPHIGHO2_12_FULL_37_14]|nr:MAG: aspartate carbamoyltransferase regulatory subunit [Gammaproteobacteria bacterium RIFCSPHIGHO2_12_FULL_37_14]
MSDMLSVSAIKNGTVIDHIVAGQGLRIIYLLGMQTNSNQVTIGLNLPSKRIGKKDLIKIENRILTEDEANEIVIFSPAATINVINNFQVVDKIKTHLPTVTYGIFNCPNRLCVTQTEQVTSCYYIHEQGKKIKLICHYCEKEFDRDQVKVAV